MKRLILIYATTATLLVLLAFAGCESGPAMPERTEGRAVETGHALQTATVERDRTIRVGAEVVWEKRGNKWWPPSDYRPNPYAWIKEFNIWERDNGTGLVRVRSAWNLTGEKVVIGDVEVTLKKRRTSLYVQHVTADQLQQIVNPPATPPEKIQVSVLLVERAKGPSGQIYYAVTMAADRDVPGGKDFSVLMTFSDSWYTGSGAYVRDTQVDFPSGRSTTLTTDMPIDPCCEGPDWDPSGDRVIEIGFEMDPLNQHDIAELADDVTTFTDTVTLPDLEVSFDAPGAIGTWVAAGSDVTITGPAGVTLRVADNWRPLVGDRARYDTVTIGDDGTGTYTIPECCEGEGWTDYRRSWIRHITFTLDRDGAEHRYTIRETIRRRYHILGTL